MIDIIESDGKIIIEGIRDFDLDHIFDSGQCFRWFKEEDGSYTGVAHKRVINVNYIDHRIIMSNTTLEDYQEIWRNYFDLDRDYGKIKQELSEKDLILAQAISFGEGMRILNQDKWETTISFIISQNNNIPRIKKCIASICESFGEYLGEYRGQVHYAFPDPETLAGVSLKDLDICRLGYRAKYILETAKIIAQDRSEALNQLDKANLRQAQDYLQSLCGIGPKVANCIMLFSMGKSESFPIDVWVKRVMNRVYSIDENDSAAMLSYASEHFGQYGGIAQQYLFYYIREMTKKGIEIC